MFTVIIEVMPTWITFAFIASGIIFNAGVEQFFFFIYYFIQINIYIVFFKYK